MAIIIQTWQMDILVANVELILISGLDNASRIKKEEEEDKKEEKKE